MPEARTGKRFKVNLPIRFQKTDSGVKHLGVTHDLSAAAVYITAKTSFAPGSRLNFSITLPAETIGSDRDVEIRCSGRVVRSDKTADSNSKKRKSSKHRKGIACVIDQYRFVRGRRVTGVDEC